MKPPPFRYVVADDVEQALGLLSEYGEDARLLAGGQSLVPLLNFRLAQPSVLIDISRIEDCREIQIDEGFLLLGGLARQRQLEISPLPGAHCPLLTEAVPLIGHVAIRNRGTIGGSLAHAHPAAELPAIAVALEGEVVLEKSGASRSVAAEDFFVGMMTTALEPDELLVQLRLPVAEPPVGWAFLELARRHGDFALVGVACLLRAVPDRPQQIDSARVVLMGVGDTPVRARGAESLLAGETAGSQVFREAASAVLNEIDPISDLHASARYRRHLCRVLTQQAMERAWQRLKEGPAT